MKEDDERTFDSDDNGFIFTSKVHYPNNKLLSKQNVYLDKDSRVTKVEVVDKDNNVLISMTYNKIDYDKKFDNNYFNLNSIIKKDSEDNVNNSSNEEKDIVDNNKDTIVDNNSNNNKDVVDEKDNSLSSSQEQTNDEVIDKKTETKETMSIEDVIYPMYLPGNTYLTTQERVSTDDGERLILNFGGDSSFVLVEETISKNEENVVIPVNGEFDFLSDVIGIIGNNSLMWHSNGIEYYMTSNTLETSVMVDIARSISILPVSK